MLKEILDIKRKQLKTIPDECVLINTLVNNDSHLICEFKWEGSNETKVTTVVETNDDFGNVLGYYELHTRMCLYISDTNPKLVKGKLDKLMSTLGYTPNSRVETHPILTASGDSEVGDGLFALYKHKVIKNKVLVMSISKSKAKRRKR